jgi:hypothetical protein
MSDAFLCTAISEIPEAGHDGAPVLEHSNGASGRIQYSSISVNNHSVELAKVAALER